MMKKMKMMSLILALVLSVSLLGGCAKSSTNDNENTPSSQENTDNQEATNEDQSAEEDETNADVQWPTGPAQIYVASKAGGITDLNARILAKYLQDTTGQPFTVVNQADGGGTIAYESVRTAEPDGNTLLFCHSGFVSAYWTGVYDHTYKDFTNIAISQDAGLEAYVAAADAPYDTLGELAEYAKAHPGEVKTGVQIGGGSHIKMATFGDVAGVDLKIVEAGTNTDKLAGLAGGHIDFTIQGIGSAVEYEKAGKLKILAVSGEDKKYTDYDTVADQGYPEIGMRSLFGLHGPKGMDPALVSKINEVVSSMGENEEALASIDKVGSIYYYGDTEETAEWMASEDESYREKTTAIGTNTRE